MTPADVTAALAARQDGYPSAGLSWLADQGLIRADAIRAMLFASEDAAFDLYDLLVAVGRGDLAAGRLYEGHVDAMGLVRRLGTASQIARADASAASGGLLGIWGADDPSAPARLERRAGGGATLSGRKTFASGGAALAMALVAAKDEDGRTRLVLLDQATLAGRFDEGWWDPIGMAETRSDALDLSALDVGEDALVGAAGAYEGHPAFGAGAIRFVAVQTGGVLAVWDAMREHLRAAGRADDPHQAARLAAALAEAEAAHAVSRQAFARLRPVIAWPPRSAHDPSDAEHEDGASFAADSARLLVEACGHRVTDLAVRSVGCGGLMRRHPLSRRLTDLLVYLRQPAPDAAADRLGRAVASGDHTPSFDRFAVPCRAR